MCLETICEAHSSPQCTAEVLQHRCSRNSQVLTHITTDAQSQLLQQQNFNIALLNQVKSNQATTNANSACYSVLVEDRKCTASRDYFRLWLGELAVFCEHSGSNDLDLLCKSDLFFKLYSQLQPFKTGYCGSLLNVMHRWEGMPRFLSDTIMHWWITQGLQYII